MAKTREQKEEIVKGLSDSLANMKAAVFTSFSGISVKDSQELKKKLKTDDVEYSVAKKTLLTLALAKAGFEGINAKDFEGSVALAMGFSDEVAPAKILAEFAKEHEGVNILGGILEGVFVDAAMVNNLAKLPSKQELLAKVVGSINAPVSGFVNVLAGNIRNLVYVLDAIKESKA